MEEYPESEGAMYNPEPNPVTLNFNLGLKCPQNQSQFSKIHFHAVKPIPDLTDRNGCASDHLFQPILRCPKQQCD